MKRLVSIVALVGLAVSSAAADGAGVSGTYVEARTAEVFAGGCIMNSEAGTAGRQAVLAWKVDQGAYNGVPLGGLSIVAAIAADQNLGIQEIGGAKPTARAAIYVDARASMPQQLALIAMANELSNGIVGTVVAITASEVAFTEDGEGVRVAAGPIALDVGKHVPHDTTCGGMQWFQPLSSVSGATIGMTNRHSFTGTSLGTKWSAPNMKAAFFGTFAR